MSSIEQRKELHKLIMAFSHDSFHHYFSFSPWVLMTFLRLYSTVHSNDIFIKHVAVSWPFVTPAWPWRLCGTNCCMSYSISSRLLTEDISLEPLVFTWLEIFLNILFQFGREPTWSWARARWRCPGRSRITSRVGSIGSATGATGTPSSGGTSTTRDGVSHSLWRPRLTMRGYQLKPCSKIQRGLLTSLVRGTRFRTHSKF